MEEFTVQMKRWRALEAAARALEQEVRELGQFAASPEAAALMRDAAQRRKEADDYLNVILGPSRKRSAGQEASNDAQGGNRNRDGDRDTN
jgi:hypothetical protein